jgi:hypothetical protein
MNEKLRHKSIIKNQGGETLSLINCSRKIVQSRQGHSRSRGRSKSRRGKLICYHYGKIVHMRKGCWF